MALEQCIVDDVAAILAGLPMSLRARHLIPESVAAEVIDRESRERLEFMLESGLARLVEDPPVERVASMLPGRLASKLSRADLTVLAVALEARGECGSVAVATDDYALQEAAATLGFGVVRVRYPGSRVVRKWASKRRGGGSSKS